MKFGHQILKYREDIIRDLTELIAVPSVCTDPVPGKPFGENSAKALETILNMAKKLGLNTTNVSNYAGDARYGEGEDFVDVLSHVDIVPVGKGWDSDPLKMIEKDGYFYGRGVADDKGASIISLYCLKALKDAGIQGKHTIRTIFGGGEEIASNDLDVYYEKEGFPVMGFTPDCCYGICHCEKGILRADFVSETPAASCVKEFHAGTVVNAVPAEATAILECTNTQYEKLTQLTADKDFSLEKDGSSVTVKSFGKAAHGAEPHLGKNAAGTLLELLDQAFTHEELGNFFSFLIDCMGTNYTGEKMGIKMSDEPSGDLTLNLGIIEFTSEKGCASIDIRYPATKTKEDIWPSLQKYADRYELKLVEKNHDAPLYIPKDAPLINLLKNAYHSVMGEDCDIFSTGGGTYARHTPNRVVAFGPVFPEEPPTNAHNCNENINVEKLFLHAQICLEAMYEMFVN